MPRRTKIDPAQRTRAIQAVRDEGRSIASVARELGVARATLTNWLVQLDTRPEAERTRPVAAAPARRQPTILDVARRAGVSKSVVSRALGGQYGVSEAARTRVLEAAGDLGYTHNAMAQSLSAHRTFTLGVLVRDASAGIYGHTQAALQERASHRGYRVITTTGTGTVDLADERAALRDLTRLRVEGLIVCSGPLPVDDILTSVGKTPVVIASRVEHDPRINAVFADEARGVSEIVDHLVDLGHRRVAVPMVNASTSGVLATRSALFMRAVTDAGSTPVPIPCGPAGDAQQILDGALSNDCTAITAPNDRYTLELLDAARQRNTSVPGRISITGFDGIPPYTSPFLGLTTWAQPITDIGAHAVDRLLDLIVTPDETPTHTALPGRLIAGRTTAGPQ